MGACTWYHNRWLRGGGIDMLLNWMAPMRGYGCDTELGGFNVGVLK